MLSFHLYDPSRLSPDSTLELAYLVGAHDIAIPATITYRDSLIICERRSSESAALALSYNTGEAGQLTLQTNLLPEREESYMLVSELARSRIRLILAKMEDWALTDLDPFHPVMTKLAEAKSLFIRALTIGHTPEAEEIAHEALLKAIQCGEELSEYHAEVLLSHRLHLPNIPRTTLGCNVHPAQWSERLRTVVDTHFDYISIPLRWRDLEPDEGEYSWQTTDRWIEWAVRTAHKPVLAGPVLNLSRNAVPDWLYIWEHDYETLRELVAEHVRAVVTRYRRAVNVWNVVSGMNINDNFSLTYEQMMDLTRVCLLLVKKLQPNARVMLEVAQPFAEQYAFQNGALPPLMYLEMVLESGLPVDSIGVRLQLGQAAQGRSTRDLLQISSMLDRFARLEHPVVITAAGVPSDTPVPPEKSEDDDDDEGLLASAANSAAAGYWHQPWNETLQADWLTRVTTIALSKPYVESLCWQELYDHETSDMPYGGLINSAGMVKPALMRMGQIRACLQTERLPREAGHMPEVTSAALQGQVGETTP